MSPNSNSRNQGLSSDIAAMEEVYGRCDWSESALMNLLRVMELTRQDEQIHQMRNMEEHQRFLVEQIVNLLMIQHEAAAGRHNYWQVAANLIQAEYGVKE